MLIIRQGGFIIIMATTEPIRNKKQLRQLADYFLKRGKLRNYALIVLGALAFLAFPIIKSLFKVKFVAAGSLLFLNKL